MPAGDLAGHAANLRAVERGKRDHAVMRAHAPGRAELGTRGRDHEQRRLRAALGERVDEVERGRVGPVQILDGEDDRLRPCAREKPGRHRRQLPAAQFLGRKLGARSGGSGISTSGASRGACLAGVELHLRERALEVREPPLGGRLGAAEALPSPFGDRVERRVLQELRGGPFDPGVRRLARASRETPR